MRCGRLFVGGLEILVRDEGLNVRPACLAARPLTTVESMVEVAAPHKGCAELLTQGVRGPRRPVDVTLARPARSTAGTTPGQDRAAVGDAVDVHHRAGFVRVGKRLPRAAAEHAGPSTTPGHVVLTQVSAVATEFDIAPHLGEQQDVAVQGEKEVPVRG